MEIICSSETLTNTFKTVGHYNPEVSNRYLSSMFEIKNIDLSGVYILWVTYLFYDEPFLRKLYQVTLGHVYSNYERKLILPCIPPPQYFRS